MSKLPVISTSPVSFVQSSTQNLIDSWKDYAKTRELEITKRDQIKANRDVALAKIQAQTEILRTLISDTFAERATNFDKYFALLETGFTNHDDQQINAALSLIVEQTKVSPMAQVANLIKTINDPNNNDIIEI